MLKIKEDLRVEMRTNTSQTEDLCAKLINQLLQRIKNVEESVYKGSIARKNEEILAKQQKEFNTMKKSLLSSIETAVEGMKSEIRNLSKTKTIPIIYASSKSRVNPKLVKDPENLIINSFNIEKQSTPNVQAKNLSASSVSQAKGRSVSAHSKEYFFDFS